MASDQGPNFESSILCQTLEAFCIKKIRTTAYHPEGDGMVERFNRSLLQLLSATYHLFYLHIALQFIPQQVYWHLNLCLDAHLHTIHSPPPEHITKTSYNPNYHSYLI